MLDAIKSLSAHTPEPIKVYAGALGALGVSYSGVQFWLSNILIVVTIIYTCLKIVRVWKNKRASDTETINRK